MRRSSSFSSSPERLKGMRRRRELALRCEQLGRHASLKAELEHVEQDEVAFRTEERRPRFTTDEVPEKATVCSTNYLLPDNSHSLLYHGGW